jgi:hypothetical protein
MIKNRRIVMTKVSDAFDPPPVAWPLTLREKPERKRLRQHAGAGRIGFTVPDAVDGDKTGGRFPAAARRASKPF